MRILILAVLVWCSLLCRAEAQSPLLPEAKAAFERYAPSSRFHDYATVFGDLNGDGITDFATFIGDPNYNDNGVENLKIAAFLGAKGNSFNFYELSSEKVSPSGDDRTRPERLACRALSFVLFGPRRTNAGRPEHFPKFRGRPIATMLASLFQVSNSFTAVNENNYPPHVTA